MRRLTLLALAGIALAACGGSPNTPAAPTALKVAWIYVGSANDGGWTKAQKIHFSDGGYFDQIYLK